MNKLIEELQNKEKELQRLKMNLEKSLHNAPEGKLRITHKKDAPLYYHRTQFHKSDPNYYGSYIKKENMTLVQDLAQKDYEEKLLKVINKQLIYIHQFLQNFHLSSLSEVYEHMSKDRKTLVNAHVLSDESFAKMWQEKPYVSKGFAVNDPEIYTEKNERVRSNPKRFWQTNSLQKGFPTNMNVH